MWQSKWIPHKPRTIPNEELQSLLDKEEILWKSEVRVDWIRDREQDTRCYDALALPRQSKNKIISLKDSMGNWIEDPEWLHSHMWKHLQNFFTSIKEMGSIINIIP